MLFNHLLEHCIVNWQSKLVTCLRGGRCRDEVINDIAVVVVLRVIIGNVVVIVVVVDVVVLIIVVVVINVFYCFCFMAALC